MKTQVYKQLDIYWVQLDPTVGAETQKERPCVILQSSLLNLKTNTTIVAPILPNHKDWAYSVNVAPTKQNGLNKERYIHMKQIRVVDTSRVKNKVGTLEEAYMPEIKDAIRVVFNI